VTARRTVTAAAHCAWRRVLAEVVAPASPEAAAVFSAIFAELACRVTRIGLTGGLSRGDFDRWSDLDLLVAGGSGGVTLLDSALAALPFERVAVFHGGHVGRPDLRIAYFRHASRIVKADIEYVSVRGARTRYDVRWLGAPPHARDTEAAGRTPDVERVADLAVAWLWFCAARIARGEAFAAARAIDMYREDVLLPVLLKNLNLPQQGHRRLEQRLSPELMADLITTYPAALDQADLSEALVALADVTSRTFTRLERVDVSGRIHAVMVDVRAELGTWLRRRGGGPQHSPDTSGRNET
jgi:hypothetical protein